MHEAGRWVFGYGSLMWDKWEVPFQGSTFSPAVLSGFRRSFNKASTRNWGTTLVPGPTLGLEVDSDSKCIGTAFLFEERMWAAVQKQLVKREGKSFNLELKPILLPSGDNVDAIVPINSVNASSYIGNLPIGERARLIVAASGRDGRCIEYFTNVASNLQSLNVKDLEIAALSDAISNIGPK